MRHDYLLTFLGCVKNPKLFTYFTCWKFDIDFSFVYERMSFVNRDE